MLIFRVGKIKSYKKEENKERKLERKMCKSVELWFMSELHRARHLGIHHPQETDAEEPGSSECFT